MLALVSFPFATAQTPPPTKYDQLNYWQQGSMLIYCRIQYSIPAAGTVEVGNQFQVPVEIDYKENQYGYTGALDTFNVTVHLVSRPTPWWTPYGSDNSASNDNSRVRTYFGGLGYSHTFTMAAPQDLGHYDVYVTWYTANQAQNFLSNVGPAHVDATTHEWSTLDWGVSIPGFTTILPPGSLGMEVNGLANGTSIVIDGNSEAVTGTTYAELPLSVGQHTLQAPSTIPLGQGIQAVFTGWSDGVTTNPRTIYFNGTGARIAAQYETQFYLQVDSNYGPVEGAGWYNANSDATVTASTPSFTDPHVLDHWEGDYAGKNPQGTVHMDGPKRVSAVYRTDYSNVMWVSSIFIGLSFAGAIAILRRGKKHEQPKQSAEVLTYQPTTTPQNASPSAIGFKYCVQCGANLSAENTLCPSCNARQFSQPTYQEQRGRTNGGASGRTSNVLFLRATFSAVRDVESDPNLGSLSLLEAYVNNDPERKIVEYERVKQLPTGSKVREKELALISKQIVLCLVLPINDDEVRYTITTVKNLGVITKDVRMEVALKPPLDVEIRILPPRRRFGLRESNHKTDSTTDDRTILQHPDGEQRPIAGSSTRAAEVLLFRTETVRLAREAAQYEKAGARKEAIRSYLLAVDLLKQLRELLPNGPEKETVNRLIGNYESKVSRLNSPMEEPAQGSSTDKMFLAEKPSVTWNDVVGQEESKRAIENSIIYPMKRPDLYPLGWSRGILLYGPPGCGKTLLAAAVAHEVDATFFNVDAANVVSKWVGDSERNIAELFRVARVKEKDGPAIIFIDEIDSLAGHHDWEAAHDVRMKNQFLKEMDSLLDKGHMSRVYVVGATNRPWDLDEAFIRRFQKRIYVPLPSSKSRLELVQKYVQNLDIAEEVNLRQVTTLMEGYSGSDIHDLFLDLQEMIARETIATDHLGRPREVTMEDFREMLKKRKPSVASETLRQYEEWAAKSGAS
jgi:vacuolar protein-sorting-associated protein 4